MENLRGEIVLSIVFTLLASSTSAYIPWFIGLSTVSGMPPFSYASSDCIKSSGHNAFNPFLGETLIVNLDPNHPANQPIIAQNSGTLVNVSEFCVHGDLVEFACGNAYPSVIGVDAVGAVEWSRDDLSTFFNSPTGQSWECVDAAPGNSGQNIAVPAFYAPSPPVGFVYTPVRAVSGPTVTAVLSGNVLNAGATWSAPAPTSPIFGLYVVGPAPYHTVVSSMSSCQYAYICFLPNIALQCPNVYWIIGLYADGNATVMSTVC